MFFFQICILLISQSEGDSGRDATKPCGPHQHYHPCKKHCESTCNDPDPKMCAAICTGGCMCDTGYYRNGEGECVKRNQCGEKRRKSKARKTA
ncbi:trypsin Inhibitor like cysteine rich domain protein [Ancylostoma caninum]|uniref:Trypsin Inhibitor like cysteine rich domain protein n=1 Tax=Ancylostoma caninum TaxID=29170 RepID=A0A368G7M5_ANCCA|nr:trypsin Inhibitor like cysteine rich domain protein [Ancylostoma caninum]